MVPNDNLARVGTPMSAFLAKKFDELSRDKSQKEIAKELGYAKSNILSMFKSGEAKVPLEKIPALSRALDVDIAHLFRLGLEQYWPDLRETLRKFFHEVPTPNEVILLHKWRTATENTDPTIGGQLEERIDSMLNVFRLQRMF